MKLILANGFSTDVEPVEACSFSSCQACGQSIFWVRTKKGKLMPAQFIEKTDEAISHFATCPKADHFRKKQ